MKTIFEKDYYVPVVQTRFVGFAVERNNSQGKGTDR